MNVRAASHFALVLPLALAAGCATARPAAGGGESLDTHALCTPPANDYTGWTTVRQGPVTFMVPPGFRRSASTGHESGIWEQTWEMGQRSIYVYTTRDAEQYRTMSPRCDAEMAGRRAALGLMRISALETMGFHRTGFVGQKWAAGGNWDFEGPFGFRVYVTGRDDEDTAELARAVMWSVRIDDTAERPR